MREDVRTRDEDDIATYSLDSRYRGKVGVASSRHQMLPAMLFTMALVHMPVGALASLQHVRSSVLPAPRPFPGSRIMGNNASWGVAVNTWAKKPAAQT